MTETTTVEYELAWAVIIVVTSVLLVGFLWVILDIFVQHILAETTDVPSYTADRVDYSTGWLLRFWTFIPAMALGSFVAWGLLRAVSERGGPL
ncbi:hypothetical protein [Salinadaptatus halalkaliphilus]|uniref:hypothetical protein n=1 Tax=Salinadaptatus halalkaliphilus TaxID=2419781 RepID=UPI00157FCC3A|nr:hypothetical protein [Salinadaptatus halalkaliphilus]